MLKDGVATQILKQAKLVEEGNLFNCAAYYTTISQTYKCVPFCCLKDKTFPINHDQDQHGDLNGGNVWEKDEVLVISVTVKDYRFEFGQKKKFNQSGKNELTRGKPPISTPTIVTDKNGMI